ncbi:phage tail tip lysozyme [Yoonia sp. R2331]|uniref:phage tail tip lysozyme n=1 Tax=Yoonia sp. R2331 TaxID=3237238 RepID=UPI0034E5BD95
MVDPQQLVAGLVQRGVPYAAALGIVGNMSVESGFDPGINEIAPLVPGSRGGFGLIQWTGPRRRQLEAFAGDRVADVDTQLDFLVHELGTTERAAARDIYAAEDPLEAARLVSNRFLRPGIPHLDRRIEATRGLMGGEAPQTPQQPMNALRAPQNAPQPQMNVLAAMQMMPRYENTLNAADFMNPRGNALNYG